MRDNAADWGPPDLNKLKGAGNLDARNGDAGEPSMWYWQVYGTSWDRQRRSFDRATKAYRRLSATLEERRDATNERYARAGGRRHAEIKQFEEEERAEQEEKEAATKELKEKRERHWRAVCGMLRRAGLQRFAADVAELHNDGLLASLYEPPAECGVRVAGCGLATAIIAFLNGEDGATLDEREALDASLITEEIGLSRDEAVALH